VIPRHFFRKFFFFLDFEIAGGGDVLKGAERDTKSCRVFSLLLTLLRRRQSQQAAVRVSAQRLAGLDFE